MKNGRLLISKRLRRLPIIFHLPRSHTHKQKQRKQWSPAYHFFLQYYTQWPNCLPLARQLFQSVSQQNPPSAVSFSSVAILHISAGLDSLSLNIPCLRLLSTTRMQNSQPYSHTVPPRLTVLNKRGLDADMRQSGRRRGEKENGIRGGRRGLRRICYYVDWLVFPPQLLLGM